MSHSKQSHTHVPSSMKQCVVHSCRLSHEREPRADLDFNQSTIPFTGCSRYDVSAWLRHCLLLSELAYPPNTQCVCVYCVYIYIYNLSLTVPHPEFSFCLCVLLDSLCCLVYRYFNYFYPFWSWFKSICEQCLAETAFPYCAPCFLTAVDAFCHHNARKSLDSRVASLTAFFVFTITTISEYLPLTTVLLTPQQLKMCWKQRWRLPLNWHIPSLFK